MKKAQVIQRVIDKVFTVIEASETLGCSERTVYRYMDTLKHEGPPGLIHGLVGKPSNHTPENGKYACIKRIAHDKRFAGWGPTFLAEKMEELYGVIICRETLRQRMIKRGLREVNHRKRKVSKERRERKASYGMMSQFDGSYHDRLGNGDKECLLVAIDDATGIPVKMMFSVGEGLEDIYSFWKEYMREYGKPVSIYLDRHATYKVNSPEDIFDEELRTRFSRAMKRIGVSIIYAKSAEGKGRVERGFKTHQDRLVKELRLAGIRSIDKANKFLEEYYIPKHIRKFAVEAKEPGDYHIPQSKDEIKEMEWIFAEESDRILKSDATIAYKSKRYQVKKGITLPRKAKIQVCESMRNEIRLYYAGELLPYTLIHYK